MFLTRILAAAQVTESIKNRVLKPYLALGSRVTDPAFHGFGDRFPPFLSNTRIAMRSREFYDLHDIQRVGRHSLMGELGKPASYPGTILIIFCTENSTQVRLFIEHDEQVKDDSNAQCVQQDARPRYSTPIQESRPKHRDKSGFAYTGRVRGSPVSSGHQWAPVCPAQTQQIPTHTIGR